MKEIERSHLGFGLVACVTARGSTIGDGMQLSSTCPGANHFPGIFAAIARLLGEWGCVVSVGCLIFPDGWYGPTECVFQPAAADRHRGQRTAIPSRPAAQSCPPPTPDRAVSCLLLMPARGDPDPLGKYLWDFVQDFWGFFPRPIFEPRSAPARAAPNRARRRPAWPPTSLFHFSRSTRTTLPPPFATALPENRPAARNRSSFGLVTVLPNVPRPRGTRATGDQPRMHAMHRLQYPPRGYGGDGHTRTANSP